MKPDILIAIETERAHQDRLYAHDHSPAEYILILRKLLKDAENVWYLGGDAVLMHKIRQICATCVKAMEDHGAFPRVEPDRPKATTRPKSGERAVICTYCAEQFPESFKGNSLIDNLCPRCNRGTLKIRVKRSVTKNRKPKSQ